MALPLMLSVLIQKSTPMVGMPADVNTPSVYRLTILVLPTPASPVRHEYHVIYGGISRDVRGTVSGHNNWLEYILMFLNDEWELGRHTYNCGSKLTY